MAPPTRFHPRLARLAFLVAIILSAPSAAHPQDSVAYLLDYRFSGDSLVRISLALSQPRPAPLALVMPRSYPGGYNRVPYDSFLTNVRAFSSSGAPLAIQRDPDGPRWQIGRAGESVARIEYEVDIARMERDLLSAVDSSKVRKGYAGLLGYSIFAFLDGLEDLPVKLQVDAPSQWPILSTLAPRAPFEPRPGRSQIIVSASDYYHLADSEILMGPDLQARRLDGDVPLVMAIYAECNTDLAVESQLARQALDRVSAYFSDAPLAAYTVQLELLKPLPGHDYAFSQEHLDSGTFALSIGRAITEKTTQQARDSMLFNYAHHIAHSWIPKRAYGVGYMPFNWEITPVLDTVWFNEGFAQYAALEALAAAMPPAVAAEFRQARLNRYREILRDAPPVIQRMGLLDLSREASFLYSDDFRLGKSSFARGALIAAEMDDSIRSATANAKSLRDALLYLIALTRKNHRGFAVDELPAILAEGVGADPAALRTILTHWLAPPKP